MMEKEYIQKLLESYMSAETTEEEEQLLSDYFCTHKDIPAEWRNFSILFRGLRQNEQKPYATSMMAILKWSAAAAVIVFVFVTGAMLMHQEETNKPVEPIAQNVVEEPANNDMVSIQEAPISIQETPIVEKPVAVEKRQTRRAKTTHSVKNGRSDIKEDDIEKEKSVHHINKMLEEADMAFSLATVQCSMNIDESFLQDEKTDKTDDETNIFL